MAVLYLLGLLLVFYALAKICDEYFVKSLDIIAKKLKLSEDVAGATFMAIGTSAPEFFTAVMALTKVGSENIGAGTIVGSAIFNILVIVGGSAVVSTAYLKWKPVVRDMGFYAVAILLLFLTFRDGVITLTESAYYLGLYAIYIFILARWKAWFPAAKKTETQLGEVAEEVTKDFQALEKQRSLLGKFLGLFDHLFFWTFPSLEKRPSLYPVTFTISILYIIFFSWLLVEFGVLFAHEVGIPEVIIALTILAGGTSVPDLIASLIVSKQGRGDMAVSNAVGSNSFDILICLGLPWFLYILYTQKPVTVATESLFSSILLLFFTVLAIFFVLGVQKFKIDRRYGYGLIGLYVLYLCYSIYLAYTPGGDPLDLFFRSLLG